MRRGGAKREVLVDILSQLKCKHQMMRAKAELLSPSLAITWIITFHHDRKVISKRSEYICARYLCNEGEILAAVNAGDVILPAFVPVLQQMSQTHTSELMKRWSTL